MRDKENESVSRKVRGRERGGREKERETKRERERESYREREREGGR